MCPIEPQSFNRGRRHYHQLNISRRLTLNQDIRKIITTSLVTTIRIQNNDKQIRAQDVIGDPELRHKLSARDMIMNSYYAAPTNLPDN